MSSAWTTRSFVAALSTLVFTGCMGGSSDPVSSSVSPLTTVNNTYTASCDDTGATGTTIDSSGSTSAISTDDTSFSLLWNMYNTGQFVQGVQGTTGSDINARQAWAYGTSCSGVLVGVLDTGVDASHPDLLDNLPPTYGGDQGSGPTSGYNFVSSTTDTTDDNLHGTHVSGIIGAKGNNTTGVVGVCWRAKIVPIKIGDQDGSIYLSDAISGIDYAISIGTKVTNNSWGITDYGNAGIATDLELLREAVSRANDAGVLFVAAAGNGDANGVGLNNDTTKTYPASYALPNILSVAATDQKDRLTSFSNYGTQSVQIAAPGYRIVSTLPTVSTAEMTQFGMTTSYGTLDGTSMATPHVTGAAALIWTQEPSLTMSQLRCRIVKGASVISNLTGKIEGGRRLNVRGAQTAP